MMNKNSNKIYSVQFVGSDKLSATNRQVIINCHKKLKELRFLVGEVIKKAKQNELNSNYSAFEQMRDMIHSWKRKTREILENRSQKIAISRMGFVWELEFGLVDNKQRRIEALTRIRNEIREKRVEQKRNRPLTNNNGEIICHLEPDYFLNKMLDKCLKNPKKPPEDSFNYVGIEIECTVPEDTSYQKALYPYREWVCVSGDSSITPTAPNHEGLEVKILAHKSKIKEVIEGVTSALQSIGAHVNKSCGLHVHFDMRNKSEEKREQVYQNLYHSIPLLYSIVPKSRRTNSYCSKNRSADYQAHLCDERYKAINVTALRKYGTFEVRLFGGTLEAVKINNWINLLYGIIKSEVFLRCPRSFDTAKTKWNLTEETLNWCKERQLKYDPTNALAVTHESDSEQSQRELVEVA